jgi:hypothetical protein
MNFPRYGMQAVDVLRPLDLRKLILGPRELEVYLRVQLALRDRHTRLFDGDRLATCDGPQLAPLRWSRVGEVVEAQAERVAVVSRPHELPHLSGRRVAREPADHVDGRVGSPVASRSNSMLRRVYDALFAGTWVRYVK